MAVCCIRRSRPAARPTARGPSAEFVHGEPFNITDVEVAPNGMLYFTTGGRNTTGGLWRLRYKGAVPAPPDMTGVLGVVRQPQPLSSWGWAAIEKAKAAMGASFARSWSSRAQWFCRQHGPHA